jgi:ABC-type Zn uptake system ZnuABC Zn-binding protein ZnuA
VLRRRPSLVASVLALAVSLVGCAGGASHERAASGTLAVVTTTTTLANFAQAVGGARATVTSIVPVGASPETYAPTPQDIASLSKAQVIVENGAGLEGWLDHTLAAASNATATRVVCTAGLPVQGGNPHLWVDPVFAKAYVEAIRGAFDRADPTGAADYDRNARAYERQLDALVARTRRAIATIPSKRRTMIVFHDAWRYYDARFGIALVGVLETSPGREPTPDHLAELTDIAKRDDVRAVFAEPEYSPKLLEALGRSAGIRDVRILYDDSVGTDPRTTTYVGMIDTDTHTIVAALR